MNLVETVRFALRGVTANKLRSSLTVLGILIGVAAVILLVAVGNGAQQNIQRSIENLGTNTLTVQSGGGRGGTSSRSTALTPAIASALVDRNLAPDVLSASPVVSSSESMTYGGTDHTVNQFIGTTPEYLPASNYSIGSGTRFTDADVTAGRKVVVIGTTVVTDLFPGVDPIGKQITVNGTLFTIVGVLAEKGATGFLDPNDVVIAPVSAVRASLTGYGALSQILVEAVSPDRVDAAETEITDILNTQLKVTDPTNEPFRILNQAQLLSTRTSTLKTFTVLLGAVAGISLLVGGIGITNIMMVTVTERTREIGIRKALGARRRTILTQFLVEATVLSMLGGGLGVIGALIGSRFKIVGIAPAIVPTSVLLALGVSVAVGLFFGSYPASRAASLRPIEALRYE
jgi:putative ABC transport system permease protein